VGRRPSIAHTRAIDVTGVYAMFTARSVPSSISFSTGVRSHTRVLLASRTRSLRASTSGARSPIDVDAIRNSTSLAHTDAHGSRVTLALPDTQEHPVTFLRFIRSTCARTTR
jgi:hypothetical protein